jgi:hypothetical protein
VGAPSLELPPPSSVGSLGQTWVGPVWNGPGGGAAWEWPGGTLLGQAWGRLPGGHRGLSGGPPAVKSGSAALPEDHLEEGTKPSYRDREPRGQLRLRN